MKLQLKNFCCWENNTFDFPDIGTVLMHAPSGSGKSSIMKAIIFALFGSGTKIVQHGKKKCEVTLELNNLKVYRSKGPGRLVVNDSYEDDVAQGIICKYVSSNMMYLSQDYKSNFVNMGPTDKLEYLERIVFDNVDVQKTKSNLYNITKERENNVNQKQIELDGINRILKDIEPTTYTQEEYESPDCIRERIHHKKIMIDEELNRKREYERKLNHANTLKHQINETCKRIEECKSRISKNEEHVHDIDKLKARLAECKEYIKYTELKSKCEQVKKEYLKQQELYESTFTSEKNDIEAYIHELKTKISTFQDYTDDIRMLSKQISIIDEYDRIQKQINELPEYNIEQHDEKDLVDRQYELKTKLTHLHQIYTCPSCTSTIRFNNGKLEKYKDEIIDEEHIHKELQLIKSRLIEVQNFKTTNEIRIKLTNALTQLQLPAESKQVLSDRLDKYKKEQVEKTMLVQELTKQQNHLNSMNKKYLDIETYINELYTNYIDLRKRVNSEKVDVICEDGEISQVEKNISLSLHHLDLIKNDKYKLEQLDYEMDQLIIELELYKDIVTPYTDKIEIYNKELEDLYICLDKSIVCESNRKNKEVYDKYTFQKNTFEQELKTATEKYNHALKLKSKILQAETLSMKQLIDTVNMSVQYYVDLFFDNPMSVKIISEKETKTQKKHQIGLDIVYKGNSVDISNLSGGERDRVVLAFTLAFSDYIQSPILLLDECVSSLDEDNADNVFSVIKENNKNKLVIVVAHQIVKGLFDDVLDITKQI